MKPLTIKPMAVARLRPYANNARTHSKKQIRQIADSIAKFGFTNPVLVGDDDEIIAGHGRVEAAKLLGLPSVPTLRLSHLDAAQRRAYVLADNKLALNAGWDREMLAIELQALAGQEFDVEATGFSLDEVKVVVEGARASRRQESGNVEGASEPAPATAENANREKRRTAPSPSPRLRGEGRDEGALNTVRTHGETPHPDPLPAKSGAREQQATVTRAADTWLLGRHRLLCADPGDITALDRMLQEERLVFIAFDPAYCDRIAGHFRQLTGHDATLAETGQSFAEVAEQRGAAATAAAPRGQAPRKSN
jgi:hypothetical protein